MGLDSVELVLGFEKAFEISVADEDWGLCRTPRQCVDVISRHVVIAEGAGACLSQRAFQRLRRSIMEVTSVPRKSIRPRTRLREILPKPRRRSCEAVRAKAALPRLGAPGWLTWDLTVADWVVSVVADSPKELRETDGAWTRGQVREVVRAVVREQLGVKNFSDDADFVRDLGMD